MRALATFFRALPELRRTTRHLAWPQRLGFWLASYRTCRREARDQHAYETRQRAGDPARRAACCAPRPDAYPANAALEDIPELAQLLTPAGIGLGGHIRFYDCTVCGQAWFRDWEPGTHGGAFRLRKMPDGAPQGLA
jgi:hypothetical protein